MHHYFRLHLRAAFLCVFVRLSSFRKIPQMIQIQFDFGLGFLGCGDKGKGKDDKKLSLAKSSLPPALAFIQIA